MSIHEATRQLMFLLEEEMKACNRKMIVDSDLKGSDGNTGSRKDITQYMFTNVLDKFLHCVATKGINTSILLLEDSVVLRIEPLPDSVHRGFDGEHTIDIAKEGMKIPFELSPWADTFPEEAERLKGAVLKPNNPTVETENEIQDKAMYKYLHYKGKM